MAIIPCICDCGYVWFNSQLVRGTVTAIIERSTIDCPHCGKIAKMVDGTYSQTPDAAIGVIRNPAQFKILLEAITEIQWMIAQKKPPEEIRQAIDKHYPFLSYLKRFLPNSFQDLVVVVGLLYGLVTYLNSGVDAPKPQEIRLPPEIAEALRDIADKLPDNQPSIQPAPKESKQPGRRGLFRRRGRGFRR